MTFATQEASRTLGTPIELYLFRYATDSQSYFAYTDHDEPLVFDDPQIGEEITYLPVPVERDSIEVSGKLERSELKVTLPIALPIYNLFKDYPPGEIVQLTIRQGHADNPEFPVAWTGRVVGFNGKDENLVTFRCEPIATMLRRVGLRRHFQLGCPHVLYGDQCGASKPAATLNKIVVGVLRNKINLGIDWWGAKTLEKFVQGMIEWTLPDGRTDKRSILSVEENGDVFLTYAPTGLHAGDAVNISLGCNHQMNDCRTVHENILNFGGCPWVPNQSPFGIRNNYY
ncbi:phage BR0599 family protein [Sphingopyxis sp. GW247-27LB]|uniref:phage BR0599 family protein n=1 Tax=Sphingopyxis sp. GW247-27LB TaxID=2012632 RepID=UPI000BA6A4D4|nr:phage BR0599 family protein [Sphingopyxis sp. GW247-27LB]PAL23543.1 hypothetical protein CD928_05605 [Sphingopyxis sp. GW247-27LB]